MVNDSDVSDGDSVKVCCSEDSWVRLSVSVALSGAMATVPVVLQAKPVAVGSVIAKLALASGPASGVAGTGALVSTACVVASPVVAVLVSCAAMSARVTTGATVDDVAVDGGTVRSSADGRMRTPVVSDVVINAPGTLPSGRSLIPRA